MSNLNDNAVLRDNLEKVLDENKRLKTELAKYKPEISIELNFDNRSIDAKIEQSGKVGYFSMNKEDIDYYQCEEKVNIFSTALCEIFKQVVKDEISGKIEAIENNINQIKGI